MKKEHKKKKRKTMGITENKQFKNAHFRYLLLNNTNSFLVYNNT